MSNSTLQPVTPPISSALPSEAFQLLPEEEKTGLAEDALFNAEVEQVQNWWNTRRYAGIKRPYSAADVVSKRGALQQTYPSSLMARKLFELLADRAAKGEPVHTSVFVNQSIIIATRAMADMTLDYESGSNRPCANDPTSTESRSSLRFRMGLLFCSNNDK